MSNKYHLVLCTCPDQDCAQHLATMLIEGNLAACVNILPGIMSVYRWQGKIENSQEQLLLIKARADMYAQIEKMIVAHHPYELPEVIAVPIQNGLAGYLSWVALANADKPADN